MAKKIEYNYNGSPQIAYQEDDLVIIQKDNKTWTVLHFQTGKSVTDGQTWNKKKNALAFAHALLDFKFRGKGINWKANTYDEFYKLNKESTITDKLWPSVKHLLNND